MQKFDEYNKLDKGKGFKKAIDYETYFGEMDLDDMQKEERIKMARKLDDVFFFLFALVDTAVFLGGEIDIEYLKATTEQRFRDAVAECDIDSRAYTYLDNYITYIVDQIVTATQENADDDYYTSDDRAMYLAENEANSIENYIDMENAIESGANAKRWITMMDKKVRHTHQEVDGNEVAINEPFEVGDSFMLFPKDTSYGAEPKEIVNCRCCVEYFHSEYIESNGAGE